MIRLEDCTVVYPSAARTDRPALRSLTLEIQQGGFVTVVGSNGAGKSTLLKLISGLADPSPGRVFVDGDDITGRPAYRRTRTVAQVFQDPLAGTCGNLTVEENFAIAARRGSRRGFGRAVSPKLRGRVAELLVPAGLGLEHRLATTVGELSGGQRQVIALAMSTMAEAKVLLLDEHTAALDPHTASVVMDMTDRMARERGLTVLMVTHSLDQALRFGDRTIMLHEGRVVFDTTGPERSNMQVADLLRLFQTRAGQSLVEDRMLLANPAV